MTKRFLPIITRVLGDKRISTIAASVELPKLYPADEKRSLIFLAAGLPDAPPADLAIKKMSEVLLSKSSQYSKYDTGKNGSRGEVIDWIKFFAEENFAIKSDQRDNFIFTPGSSIVIDDFPRSITNRIVSFSPIYPNMQDSADRSGSKVDIRAKIEPRENGRWGLNLQEFKKSLDEDIEFSISNSSSKPLGIYLNFPHNPTGYSPTKEEYQELVNVLLDNLRSRNEHNLSPAVIAEDTAYAIMMHGNRKYYSLFNAIADLKKDAEKNNNNQKLELLNQLEANCAQIHSFSKDLALAAHRAAYFYSPNPEILAKVTKNINLSMISPPQLSMAATCGAMAAGINKEAMKKYEDRSIHLVNLIISEIGNNFIPAKADAGFFVIADFKDLKGFRVKADTLNKLHGYLQKMPTELKEYYQERLQDGVIGGKEGSDENVAKDVAVLLSIEKGIIVVPTGQFLRFSVGSANQDKITEGVKRISECISELRLYNNKPRPSTISKEANPISVTKAEREK
ncbi:MAG: pyridoxal phosphate-dependent aminotransferase [Rickettsiales bacterium]|nr:pyridoxal phosphate-dependent aminotransferase [Rickettsiales bacterium]